MITVLFSVFADLRWLSNWDDFGEWGAHAFIFFHNNGFIRAEDVGQNKFYPPGTALFSYLFTHCNNFSDGTLLLAQNLLCMSPFALIVQNTQWRQWKEIFTALTFILLSLILLFNLHIGYKTHLSNGNLVGLFFGGLLLLYYQSKREAKDILLLYPLIFCFCLLEPLLITIVLLISILLIFDHIYFYIGQTKKNNLSFSQLIGQLALCLSLVVVGLIATVSWQYYVHYAQLETSSDVHLSVSAVTHFFSHPLNAKEQGILQQMLHLLLTLIPSFCLLLIGATISVWLSRRFSTAARLLLWQVALFCGFLFYLFGLFILHLYGYQTLAAVFQGFTRYVRIYLVAWTLFTCGILCQTYLSTTGRPACHKRNSFFFIVSACSMLVLTIAWSMGLYQQKNEHRSYASLRFIGEKVRRSIHKKTTICLLFHGLSATNRIQLYYQVLPNSLKSFAVSNPQAAIHSLLTTKKYKTCHSFLLLDLDQSGELSYASLLSYIPRPSK